MKNKKVRETMIPIGEYATVKHDAMLIDAIMTLEKTREKTLGKKHHYRAVLVVDDKKRIIGKIGYLSFLKAMEPNYDKLKMEDTFNRVNLNPDFIDDLMDNFNLWEEDFLDICSRANTVKVTEAMKPVDENIDSDASLVDAMHKLIVWNTLSLLVREKGAIVGIIRLSDIYEEMVKSVLNSCSAL